MLVLVLGWSSLARAQASGPTPAAPDVEAQRSQLHEQNIAAGVLHLASAALATWTLAGGIHAIGSAGEPYCPTCDYSGEQTFFLGSLYAGAAAGVLLVIGLVLNVDHHIRLRALERSLAGARLGAGPGDFGIGVSFALDAT